MLPNRSAPPPGEMPVLTLRDTVFGRGAGVGCEPAYPVVSVPFLELLAGMASLVHGPSGSGKSTLLHGILGPVGAEGAEGGVRRQAGELRLLGASWPPADVGLYRRVRRDELAWMPQDPHLALDPLASLAAQLERATPAVDAAARTAVLQRLGIADEALLRRAPHAASGGELRRLLLAVAVLRRPALLLADEPTQGLDAAAVECVVTMLRELREPDGARLGSALLVTSHDAGLAAALDAVPVRLQDGRLVDGGVSPPGWPARPSATKAATVAPRLHCVAARLLDAHGRALLEDLDLAVHAGEIVVVLGPSGAGKTALLRGLAGQLRTVGPRSPGALRGRSPWRRRPARGSAVQLMFQDAAASLTPHRSATQLWARARHCAGRAAAGVDADAEAAALDLDPALLVRPAERLSGGERRRVALVRALCAAPEVLLCDEPTADLDAAVAERVAARIVAAADAGVAVVWSTHVAELAAVVADRVVRVVPSADGGPARCEPSSN